jgi:hypothetical protein
MLPYVSAVEKSSKIMNLVKNAVKIAVNAENIPLSAEIKLTRNSNRPASPCVELHEKRSHGVAGREAAKVSGLRIQILSKRVFKKIIEAFFLKAYTVLSIWLCRFFLLIYKL